MFINNPGHMTKMVAMPIYTYGENFSKIFSGTNLNLICSIDCNLICSIWAYSITMCYRLLAEKCAGPTPQGILQT